MQIGIDLVETSRIKTSVEKYGDKFLKRILTDAEIEYCMSKTRPYESIAARFAAKEAIGKALGTGISKAFDFQAVEITNDRFGKPAIKLRKKVKGLSKKNLNLSLSHTHRYAIAMVVIE
jgi:holo-[acyl-carrier protein] synthase